MPVPPTPRSYAACDEHVLEALAWVTTNEPTGALVLIRRVNDPRFQCFHRDPATYFLQVLRDDSHGRLIITELPPTDAGQFGPR